MTKLLTVVFAALLLTFNASAQANKINWEKNFQQAQQKALETGKPLLLDFTADWCKPCQTMEKEFWVQEDVINMVGNFIAVKVDFDGDRSTVGKYGINSIPFVAFTDPLGNIITSRRGFGKGSAADLNKIFSEMPTDFSVLKPAYYALEENDKDATALLEIADVYRASRMLVLSTDFYKRALKTDEVKNNAETAERVTAAIAANPYNYSDYKTSNKLMAEYLKDYPSGKYRELALTALTIGNAKLGKYKDADKYLEMLKTEFPASASLSAAAEAVEKAKK